MNPQIFVQMQLKLNWNFEFQPLFRTCFSNPRFRYDQAAFLVRALLDRANLCLDNSKHFWENVFQTEQTLSHQQSYFSFFTSNLFSSPVSSPKWLLCKETKHWNCSAKYLNAKLSTGVQENRIPLSITLSPLEISAHIRRDWMASGITVALLYDKILHENGWNCSDLWVLSGCQQGQ